MGPWDSTLERGETKLQPVKHQPRMLSLSGDESCGPTLHKSVVSSYKEEVKKYQNFANILYGRLLMRNVRIGALVLPSTKQLGRREGDG